MNSIKTILKYELIRYFSSPLALVYLICYLLLSGSCAIYFGHFFANNQANLWSFFDYQPWILLFFIAGISMRSWAEEFRAKTIIPLLTQPVLLSSFVWGKFLAAWLFCGIALLFTIPLWITVNIYGQPDNLVIFIGYLGLMLLSGAMLAISQTMSSITKNSVIALVLAVFVNLLFFGSSFDYVLFLARKFFNETIIDTIVSFSFLTHFFYVSRGLVELRDLVFFVSIILFFNLTTMIVISLRTKGSSNIITVSNIKQGVFVFLILLVGLFSLNIIANNALRSIRYDFTEEKYLTLTKNSKDILRNLKRPVVAKLYYSPILGERNPQVQQLFERIKLILKQYKSYSKGKFDYKIYNPKFLDKNEDRALVEGLQPIPLIDINQNALFGISFSDNLLNKSVIPFFSIERLAFLEQDLTTSIYKLHHKKKVLGLLSSLPIMGGEWFNQVLVSKWEIMKQIETLYEIKTIQTPEDLEQGIDVLMLVHPYNLSDDFIKQIKKQQKVLLLMDIATEASRLYAPEKMAFRSSNLKELSEFWGIYFADNKVVADFDNSILVDETVNYKESPSFTQDLLQFKLSPNEFNPNHRISYKLSNILFASASTILPRADSDVLFFPLLKTSQNSSLLDASYAQKSVSPRKILADYTPANSPIVLAAEFLSNNPNIPFDIIAVGDTDFIYDSFWAKEANFLDTSYFIPLFDNANFILNSLDYLTENDDLIALRGKNMKSRPLFAINNMRKLNLYLYRLKENEIFQSIKGIKQHLKEINAKKDFEERDSFTADELAIIGKMRQEIDNLRQSLSDIQTKAHANIEEIELKVKFYNIYFVPLVLLFVCFILYIKKHKISLSLSSFFFDKKQIKLFFFVLLIIGIAILTVYKDSNNSIDKYENKPVFSNFNNTINDIAFISLETGKNSLIFEKKDGVWFLKNYPLQPVYQERIRHFLSIISNMTFYEKKSDKIEDLKYFGFSSVKDKNSPMISVGFYDNNNKILNSFDIGWYDLDFGRGSKSAFIKLKNEFQVWLVNADFYDLSLDINNWTYSSLWNLRFGRLARINDEHQDKKLMDVAKKLLNTYYLDIVSHIDAKNIGKIKLKIENDNLVDIIFYHDIKNDKFFVKYEFKKEPKGKHLEFFAKYVKDKYLEIAKDEWEKIKDDTIREE